jgi:tetratricopeptide (TPR) repeat protein
VSGTFGKSIFDRIAVKEWLLLLGAGLVIFSIYSNTAQVPFIFDDARNIDTYNTRLHDLSFNSLYNAAFGGNLKTRPLANLSFALNYYFHQKELPGYHLVNTIIHFLNVVLLYFFIKITMAMPVVQKRYGPAGWVPFLAALLWGVNPLDTQSVTYIVQRMNSMAAMFFLVSCLAYIKGRLICQDVRKWGFYLISLLAAIFAFASKENAFILPFIIILYEGFFFRDIDAAWLKKHLYVPFVVVIAAAILLFAFYNQNPIDAITKGYEFRPFSLQERVLTEGRVIFFYLSLLIFPYPGRLNLLHDVSLSQSLFDPPTTILAILGLVALVLLAIRLAGKERLLSFCIVWFLVTMFMESSFFPLEIIFEHRMYLPSMLVILLFVLLGRRYLPSGKVALAVIVIIIAVFSFLTYERNKTWGNGLTFWQDCLQKSPDLGRVHNNYACYLFAKGKLPEAEKEYKVVLSLNPPGRVAGRANYNLGVILAQQGDYREAVRYYSEAVRLYPGNSAAHNNLGDMYERLGNLQASQYHLERAVSLAPNDHFAQYNLGLVYARQHKYPKAYKHFSEALRLNPGDKMVRRDLEVVKGLLEKEGAPVPET